MSSPSAPLVELRAVTAGYRTAGLGPRRPALQEADLQVDAGSVLALVGANGAGKTTLLRVILGFLRPWSGTARVAGAAPAEARRRGCVGYLPETVSLPPGWRVSTFLSEGRRRSGVTAGGDPSPGGTGLEPWLVHRTSSLSRGVARRVALAFAVTGDPRLLVLDEPFAGLDPPTRSALRAAVARAARGTVSVVLATHDLDEVERLAQRVVVVRRGRTVAAGPPGRLPRRELLALMEGGT